MGNTPEARAKAVLTQKRTYAIIKHQQGSLNSQFGTCWIFNATESRRINKEQLEIYLQQGWKKGRKMFRALSANGNTSGLQPEIESSILSGSTKNL